MVTAPLGERFVPPDIRTAIGTADFADRTVVIALKDSREAAQLALMYGKMGWRVMSASRRRRFLELIETEYPDLVVTDRFRFAAAIRSMRRDGRILKWRFVADSDKHVKVLLDAGAEAVIVRSIHHDDFFSYDVVERDPSLQSQYES